ncbi:MAG TPA: thioredoxin domain-containing protein [Bacteroidia bacterium]|nr:thioredoxin domain-containing protein [Bacteroidia bacterium]HRH09777.1 thioredoxin domain-containing protein [Bacteroidia bacterium]HRH64052.1 thioredoxin domain-containing protein [Bacteroidia bacterium]
MYSTSSKPVYTNNLIHETSPYLLQHAHNPVDWYAWNESTLQKAKDENKLLLISIGYSACHWCHVMEHESFENEGIAQLMNAHFICVKVDREERPDIDQVYMNAVQVMTGSGGWPLNCFALPDGRPIYGGTYFQPERWKNVLLNIADLYSNEPNKAIEYAQKLVAGMHQSELIQREEKAAEFTTEELAEIVSEWSKRFDKIEGGADRTPKFPLPNNYLFLLQFAFLQKSPAIEKHVHLTLQKMAMGGIYDQLGGGFARYSTDHLWKVPHFEKMLYDNAQLVSLYSEAFQTTQIELYKNVVVETLRFIEREMTSAEGAFYSALDADTEGQEGKYYVWTKEELRHLLGEAFEFASTYYSVNEIGYWEDENYILLRKKEDFELAQALNLDEAELLVKLESIKKTLLHAREKRARPGLDDKILCSWNALMIKGYSNAYKVLGTENYLRVAEEAAKFICNKMMQADCTLFHSYKNGKAAINGFLEDYCFTIEAFISLYEVTFNETYLEHAKRLMDYSIAHFYDSESGFFFFTSDLDAPLIARKMETSDNVIPASNSSIALSLFLLGHYFDVPDYLDKSRQMLRNVKRMLHHYGEGYSNWARLLLYELTPFYEIAIVGNNAEKFRVDLQKIYLPNAQIMGSAHTSKLPLLENKYVENKTLIYVCKQRNCFLPVETVDDAMKLLK